jgi:hypothetical protein
MPIPDELKINYNQVKKSFTYKPWENEKLPEYKPGSSSFTDYDHYGIP